jgi:hypothetical protein
VTGDADLDHQGGCRRQRDLQGGIGWRRGARASIARSERRPGSSETASSCATDSSGGAIHANVRWLFIVAIVLAVIWVISLFVGGGLGGRRRGVL